MDALYKIIFCIQKHINVFYTGSGWNDAGCGLTDWICCQAETYQLSERVGLVWHHSA